MEIDNPAFEEHDVRTWPRGLGLKNVHLDTTTKKLREAKNLKLKGFIEVLEAEAQRGQVSCSKSQCTRDF